MLTLAANARDAMPHGGRLTVEAVNREITHSLTEELAGINPGPYVRLQIQDTGCGMEADVQSHIFEPFFTTKETARGLGLGLFTAYGIISQNGGHITVDSTPGVGTTFTIYLPRVNEMIGEVKPAIVLRTAVQGGETILLVEDEAVVRDLVRQILQGSGYTVLEAATGEEALQICTQHAGPLHLLLADVVLPGISGPELAQQLTLLRSPLQVLYMSGYVQDTIARHEMFDNQRSYLQKPFTPDVLLRLVRETLDTTSPP
jgi:CheY-like chemotaxis protein